MTAPGAHVAVILSISSDIGAALAEAWLARGWDVAGTYRTLSPAVEALRRRGARLVVCDLSDADSSRQACQAIREQCPEWDALIVGSGSLAPVGRFLDCSFDAWQHSVEANFLGAMRAVHALLPARRRGGVLEPCVLFFAGAGTNSAPVNYSAYGVSKIALMKMCEVLDAEVADTRFVILGPGWVKTKIHEATLQAGARAGNNHRRTQEQLAGPDCTPMERVIACCDWILEAPRRAIGGRNLSLVFDPWGSEELLRRLEEDPNLYKLRRHGNGAMAAAVSDRAGGPAGRGGEEVPDHADGPAGGAR